VGRDANALLVLSRIIRCGSRGEGVVCPRDPVNMNQFLVSLELLESDGFGPVSGSTRRPQWLTASSFCPNANKPSLEFSSA
jgi:hypothetical protein